tara:strand:- start:4448 stop:4930 length:483 start_codon:yes stop_codon:yes gene_type:complete
MTIVKIIKQPVEVKVTFDFGNQEIILKIGTETKKKIFKTEDFYLDSWWNDLSIEYYLDERSKWVFSWREWANKQQFFEFSKYTQPLTGRPGDPGYEPWSDLAHWRHISKPQPGTIQTKNVYRTCYKKNKFPEINNLYFEVIGRPEKNWNTQKYITGGTGW